MSVSIDTSGMRALVGRTQAALLNLCEDVANEGGDETVLHAKAQPNFRDRTGALRSSIKASPAVVGRNMALAEVRASTPYAAHVEWGTQPHPIAARALNPRNKGGKMRLIFWWERMGYLFVGKRVNHPGTSGRYYMSRGARAAYYRMLKAADAGVSRVVAIWSNAS